MSDLYKIAIRFLHRREYSSYELREKLKQKEFDVLAIEQLLSELQEQGYQSDERFVSMVLRHEYDKGYGFEHIKRKLVHQHQISHELIQRIAEDLALDWFLSIERVLTKKFPELNRSCVNEYQKAYRFLQYRGFRIEEIRDVL